MKSNIKINENRKWIILLGISSLIVFVLYVWCFYPQTGIGGEYSDTKVHIIWAQNFFTEGAVPDKTKVYPLYYLSILFFGKLFNNNYYIGTAVYAGLWAVLTHIIQAYILKDLLNRNCKNVKIILYCMLLNFIWPFDLTGKIVQGDVAGLYLLGGASAPMHNLSYLAAKPFAILCFYLYYKIFYSDISKLKYKSNWLYYVCFSILFLISVLQKPHFYQFFAPAGAIIAVTIWLHYGNRMFSTCVKMGLAFVPATVWIIYGMAQNMSLLTLEPLRAAQNHLGNFPLWLAIFQTLVFPIVVFVLCIWKKDINFIYTISLIAVAVALLEYLLFVEPLEVGSNNMLWGYECAIYLGFVGAIAAYETIVDKYKLSKAMQATVQGIFAVHGIIGVYVFMTFPLRL